MLPFLPIPSRLLTQALNHLLKREEWARRRLTRHAGKTLRLVVGSGLTLSLTIDAEGMVSQADPAIIPDVVLTVLLEKLSLPAWFSRQRPNMAEATHIVGDAALAQVVADLSTQLRWDPEDALARTVGDIAALRLIEGGRALRENSRRAGQRLAGNVAEYLAEERTLVLGQPALAQWRLDIAALAAQTEKLARQTAAVQSRLARLADKRSR